MAGGELPSAPTKTCPSTAAPLAPPSRPPPVSRRWPRSADCVRLRHLGDQPRSQGAAGQLSHRQRSAGFRRGIGGAGCGDRGGVGRPDRRPVGPPVDDEALGGVVFRVRARRRVGKQHLDVHRLSTSSAVSVSASRRLPLRRTSPRSHPRVSAAGSARCSSLPSCAACSDRLALTWVPFHLAGGSGKPLWLGLAAWRWTFLGELILALLYFALLFTISESPRYLVARQQISQARQVLGQLLGPRDVEVTITRIAGSLEQEKPQSWRDLRKPTGGLYSIVWVGLGLAVFQQFVGINVIFNYSDLLWEAVGFGEKSSFTIALVTTGVNVLITLVAIALIDRLGRRPLLLAGSAGMSLMLIAMTVVFAGASFRQRSAATRRGSRDCRAGRRRPVRRRVRRVLGTGAVGAAGRDVPQPHPVGGAGTGIGRAVDGQLDHCGDVPGAAARTRAGPTASTRCARCCRLFSSGDGSAKPTGCRWKTCPTRCPRQPGHPPRPETAVTLLSRP